MSVWCKASCNLCKPSYNLQIECNDRHLNCEKWSRSNECSKNSLWMAENCRKSCNKCQLSRAQHCRVNNKGLFK